MPIISHVAAMNTKRVLGYQGQLPWHSPSDLKHFKTYTKGKVIIMGRKTFDSIVKPLPFRFNIVVTSQIDALEKALPKYDHLKILPSIDASLSFARELLSLSNSPWLDEICIVGGGEIYRQTITLVDKLVLTVIDFDCQGDTFYPELPNNMFEFISSESLSLNSKAVEPSSKLFVYQKIIP